jgi:hypothetical protein
MGPPGPVTGFPYKTVTKLSVLLHDLDSKILFPAYLLYRSTMSISNTSTLCSSLLVLFCSCHPVCYNILFFNLSIECNIIYGLLYMFYLSFQKFCTPHIFSLHGRIPPVFPHMQQIKILYSNYFIQQQLMYTLMMDQ